MVRLAVLVGAARPVRRGLRAGEKHTSRRRRVDPATGRLTRGQNRRRAGRLRGREVYLTWRRVDQAYVGGRPGAWPRVRSANPGRARIPGPRTRFDDASPRDKPGARGSHPSLSEVGVRGGGALQQGSVRRSLVREAPRVTPYPHSEAEIARYCTRR